MPIVVGGRIRLSLSPSSSLLSPSSFSSSSPIVAAGAVAQPAREASWTPPDAFSAPMGAIARSSGPANRRACCRARTKPIGAGLAFVQREGQLVALPMIFGHHGRSDLHRMVAQLRLRSPAEAQARRGDGHAAGPESRIGQVAGPILLSLPLYSSLSFSLPFP